MNMYIFVLLMVQNLYLKSNNLNNKQLFQEPKDNIVGLDHRYSNVTESQNDALELLKQQLEKMRLLRTLEDTSTNDVTKLLKVEYYNKNNTNSTMSSNLHKGDLLGDWNFEGF